MSMLANNQCFLHDAGRVPAPRHHLRVVHGAGSGTGSRLSPGRRPSPAVGRRRRQAMALAAVTLVFCAGAVSGRPLAGAPSRAGPASPTAPAAESSYVVRPGDTLWAIARAVQPRGDVRPLVDRLAAGRRGRPLQPGERIVLP